MESELLALILDDKSHTDPTAESVLADAVVAQDRHDVVRAVCEQEYWWQAQFLGDVIAKAGKAGNFDLVRCVLVASSPSPWREKVLRNAMARSSLLGDLTLLQFLDAWDPSAMDVRDVMVRAMRGGYVAIVEWLLPRIASNHLSIWREVDYYSSEPMQQQPGASRNTDERMWVLASAFLGDDDGDSARKIFKGACRNNHLRFAQLLHGSGKVALGDRLFTPTDLRVCVKYAPDVAPWLFSILPHEIWPDRALQCLHLSTARLGWMHALAAAAAQQELSD